MDIREVLHEQLRARRMEWWELGYDPEEVARIKEFWRRSERLYAEKSLMEYRRRRELRAKKAGVPRWAWYGRGSPTSGPCFRFFEQNRGVDLAQLDGMIRRAGLRFDPPAASIHAAIGERMRELGLSRYNLVKLLNGKVPRRTIYHFLAGPARNINVGYLGYIFDALGITLKPAFI